MKKMICEICESQKIKKENGVFVCQDCGTEYSLEEAKNLLREIEDTDLKTTKSIVNQPENNNLNIAVKDEEVKFLAEQLKSWCAICVLREQFDNFFFGISDNKFWDIDESLQIPSKYLFLSKYPVNTDLEQEEFLKSVGKDSKTQLILNRMNSLKDHINNEYGWGGITDQYHSVSIYSSNGSKIGLLHDIYKPYDNRYYGFFDLVERFRNKGEKFRLVQIMMKSGLFSVKRTNQTLTESSADIQYIISLLSKASDAGEDKKNQSYSKFSSACDELLKSRNDLINASLELEKIFLLPIKYRNSKTLCTMLDILNDGRAYDWKELVNLYETVEYRKSMINGMENLYYSLKNINQTLLKGFILTNSNLNSINDNLRSISSKINDVISGVSMIAGIEKARLITDALFN